MKVELSIGNVPLAIRTIQDSQPDPYKALAEFVENAIDAGANTCAITRRKINGKHGLVITDDGPGFAPNKDGVPDFERVATHICDSIKRTIAEEQRSLIQGTYGIGILGFAAIGETLRIGSKAHAPKLAQFTIKRGSTDTEITVAPALASFASGSEICIWPIHKEVQSRLTPLKIAKYLGEELRDRIKKSQIKITVSDPHTKASIQVVPKGFTGTKLKDFDKAKTVAGIPVYFHLYAVSRDEAGKVYVSRRGTKVLDDIIDIPELKCDPWDRGMLEGYIECEALNISPATRRGVCPDNALTEFVAACRSIESQLRKRLDEIEKRRLETADPKLVRKLQDAFTNAMKELGDDYNWFDSPRGGSIPKDQPTESGKRKGFLLSTGPLEEVKIIPRMGQIRPNETKMFSARALDPHGAVIPLGVTYKWSIEKQIGSIQAEGDGSCVQFAAGWDKGETNLYVSAQLGNITMEAYAVVLVLDRVDKPQGTASFHPQPMFAPRELWRSKYDEKLGVLQYNTGHEDYKNSQKRGQGRVSLYVGRLVARHLVLYNFKGCGEETILERMLELTARTDKFL